MKTYITTACILGALLLPSTGHTMDQKNSEISESAIRAFSEEMNTVHTKPFEEYKTAIEAAFTKDATFEVSDTLTLNNEEPKPIREFKEREQYMADLKTGYNLLQGAQIDYKITSIEISPDKKTAVLKDATSVKNQIRNNANFDNVDMDFSSSATCTTKLKLSNSNKLQATNTSCDSKTTVTTLQKQK